MFGEKLEKQREGKGLSQEQLADILHVSRSAVAKWEQGRGLPTKESLHDISAYFGVPEQEFFSSEEACDVYTSTQKRHHRTLIWVWSLVGALALSLTGAGIYWGVSAKRKADILANAFTIKPDTFFSSDDLKSHAIPDLTPISNTGEYAPFFYGYSYHSYVDLASFDAYASSLYDLLRYSPGVSYLSFLIDRPEAAYHTVSKKRYLVPANGYLDGVEDSLSFRTCDFAYIHKALPNGRSSQDPISCTVVHLGFTQNDYYIAYENDSEKKYYYNFTLYFQEIPLEGDGSNLYYLMTEFYDVQRHDVTPENFTTFFTAHKRIADEIYLGFDPVNYFIKAQIPVSATLHYKPLDAVSSAPWLNETEQTVITNPYNWTTYIFFHAGEGVTILVDNEENNLNYTVGNGYLYTATAKNV